MKYSFIGTCAMLLLALNGSAAAMFRQPATRLLVNRHNRFYTNSFDVKSSQFTADQKRKPQDETRKDEGPIIVTAPPINPQEDKVGFFRQFFKKDKA